MKISNAQLAAATFDDQERGLIAWIRFVIDDTLVVDGVALRVTDDGRRTLSFPERRDSSGRAHPFLRPFDDRARREIEAQVFQALGFPGGASTP